jgi:phage-related protein
LQLLGSVGSAAVKLGAKVVSSIKGKAKSMASAGVDFVKGFIGGIGSMVGKVVKTAESLGKKAVGGVKKFLHIGSPSRVMRQIGVWTGEGFTNGIKQMIPRVSAMSERMANAAMFSTPAVALGGISGSIPRYTRAEQLFGSSSSRSVPSMQTINNYTNTAAPGQASTTIVVKANLDGKELANELVGPITVKQNQVTRRNNRAKGVI